jgi:CRP-like cAMP-binding protein
MPPTRAHKNLDKVAALRKADLFARTSEDVLKEAAKRAIVRQFEPGEIIFSERDQASGLYVVVQGELRSIRQNLEGREQVLSTEVPGAVLAVVPTFNGGAYYSTMIADKPSQLLCIEARDVHELCREHPELLWNVARVLGHKVRHYAELIETLALRNVDQRVAQHLLTVSQERAVRAGEGCVLEITMTQAEMASRVGSTREVVNRALGHLQRRGLIQMKGTRLLTVPSTRELSRFAGTKHPLEEARIVSELSSDIA